VLLEWQSGVVSHMSRRLAVRIAELHLETGDPDRLRTFYTQVLGLPLADAAPGRFGVQVGATRLVFQQGGDHRYHVAINIPRNLYRQALDWMAERARLLQDSAGSSEIAFPTWNADSLYFHDPVGNIMELIARHNLPNDAADPFGPECLLGVSEIGLTVDDVRSVVGALENRLGFPVFDGAGSEVFCAVGDDHGLLIVVRRGHRWYPELTVPAEPYPIMVVVQAENAFEYQLPELPYHIRSARSIHAGDNPEVRM
jgi:catechol-2,3-dioxygenase